MKKHLFYTFLVMFVITFVVTILGITKAIQVDEFYLKGLFTTLVIELVGGVIALYKGAKFFDDNDDDPKLAKLITKSVMEIPLNTHREKDITIDVRKNSEESSGHMIDAMSLLTEKDDLKEKLSNYAYKNYDFNKTYMGQNVRVRGTIFSVHESQNKNNLTRVIIKVSFLHKVACLCDLNEYSVFKSAKKNDIFIITGKIVNANEGFHDLEIEVTNVKLE